MERLLGRKTKENEILKEAVSLARKKTDLAKAIGRNRRDQNRFRVRSFSVDFLLQESSSPNKTVDRRIQRAYPANDQRCLPG
ncbi:hypothetical protein LEP1GSC175_1045 [Leptospira santarosai str. HAI821]|nr:hypothetical protein LEP1GSC175_1045 [Leptospira santarosai str. HAI821]